ncbi:hypothetical protein PFAG_05915 [Plasmodium falciparum Santa Lucia]|uniref:Surface protein n=16 Tax=Plasmodium falciparum TaxID=5833 RepID=Q8IK46_PLAF7|nr:Plasmodium exported protein, unknown function [Plasmodium falciparum 3D7]ETW33540.1 hypothetical protein PFTANZ_05788 [Plasmodium falciparum Tanzania (2000708)]ETW40223.1 hypothetical protein PFNF135_05451 [Plasmodium falciparum NF135/5.C10]ETW54470.1 hypothetical protein PFUGPA_04336 [Plasmodium falciparum Palo Alto/Uganda]ETW58792.1 hypothetical protein PFMC_05885 [Plasmodium falciparum CAMP/Malaysia]EUR62170.1 hypothetical protein PFBG_05884 [Plasmodium falciparum 7G8]EUT78010.1 hypothe|eukprot:XP_001348935.1 Plasmodium exported protein, unknown function [Plasmodium falciparum 3D7]
MNFINFKIYIFFILFHTFILSNTNIPRTNNNKNNNQKNVTNDTTPLGTIKDIIALDYIRDLLKHIELIKDEIIKDKLKKIKLLKNNKNLIKKIENLEKGLIATRLLCKNYIKNELKEIKIIKDQIVNEKIQQYRGKKEKLIDTELNKLFLQEKMKKDKKKYEQYMKKQLQNTLLQKGILKTNGIILKILQKINNLFIEITNDNPKVQLTS